MPTFDKTDANFRFYSIPPKLVTSFFAAKIITSSHKSAVSFGPASATMLGGRFFLSKISRIRG